MKIIRLLAGIALLDALSGTTGFAQDKNAEAVYKNITALKGTPADQLIPAMQFISASLNVECTFCHVQGKMDADDKPEKKTAREMIAMTNGINKDAFHGQKQVTCFSCHHGMSHPASVPPVLESDTERPHHTHAAMTSAPKADDILAKYVEALGGEAAIRKVSSRVLRGTILAGGMETPVEVFTKAPNKRLTITRNLIAHNIARPSATTPGAATDSFTAFDGTAGWMGNTGKPARAMTAPESAASSLDAEFYLALRLKDLYPQIRRGRPEPINDAMCETLTGSAPGKPSVRLYFDQKTGLLARMVRYAETPVGRNPTQIDYSDYRDAGGAKVPFRWTLSRPNGRFTVQVKEAQVNAAIDDARFEKPEGPVK